MLSPTIPDFNARKIMPQLLQPCAEQSSGVEIALVKCRNSHLGIKAESSRPMARTFGFQAHD